MLLISLGSRSLRISSRALLQIKPSRRLLIFSTTHVEYNPIISGGHTLLEDGNHQYQYRSGEVTRSDTGYRHAGACGGRGAVGVLQLV